MDLLLLNIIDIHHHLSTPLLFLYKHGKEIEQIPASNFRTFLHLRIAIVIIGNTMQRDKDYKPLPS